MISIFYDGQCGLCTKEINYYKKIAPKNTFIFYDIINNVERIEKLGFNLQEGLLYLHVVNHDNKIKIGAEAFITIWENLKYWRLFAKIIASPPILFLAKIIYKRFSQYRFKKRGYCKIDNK